MSKTIFTALLQNTAILFMIAVIFTSFGYHWLKGGKLWTKLILGFILGAITVLVMNSPWFFNEGLFTDSRSIILSLSGLFFGFVPTIIAMVVSSVYRIIVGGSYITGIALILVTGFTGLLWRRFSKKKMIDYEWWRFLLFGFIVHLFMIGIMFTLPIDLALQFFNETGLPILTIYPGSTLVLGLLMRNYLRNEQAAADLQKNRKQQKMIVDILQNPNDEVQSFIYFAMEEAIQLTESKLGFIFYYSETTRQFTLSAWSKIALDLCQIPNPEIVYDLDKTGLWGEPVRQRKPILLNDFDAENPLKKGVPAGHPAIHRLLEIPVFVENQIVAVVGMANKENEYTENDITQLTLLMDTIWKTIERKKAVEALKLSEENYRSLFNQSADGIFILSSDGSHIDINDSGSKMLGFSRDDFNQDFAEIIKHISDGKDEADDRSEIIEKLKNQPVFTHRKIKNRAGDWIDVEILTHLLPDGRIQKVVRDITERQKAEEIVLQTQLELKRLLKDSDDYRKALLSVIEDQKIIEDALRKSEKSYRNLFENITQGFALHKLLVDENGRPMDYVFMAANPAYQELTGLKIDQILGKKVTVALPGVEQSWIDTFGEVALTGKPKHFEDYTATLDKYYDVIAFCPDLGYFAVVISDITDRKKYELEINNFNLELENRVKRRTEELENANRELESFSYSISHDLRAPLRSINGFSQILLEEHLNTFPEEVKHYFELIRKNATMMGDLVDDLLNFSRLGRQSIKKSRIEPNIIVNEIIDAMSAEIKQSGAIINHQPLPKCLADGALIKQVFINLLSNAIKFSRNQKEPLIEIGFLQNYENQMGIKGVPSGVSCYYVKDNGVGFDMTYYDKLFGVFNRLHRAEDYEGTGVGLAIVDRIIKKHDGLIWAESAEGKGTTFYFTLGESKNGK